MKRLAAFWQRNAKHVESGRRKAGTVFDGPAFWRCSSKDGAHWGSDESEGTRLERASGDISRICKSVHLQCKLLSPAIRVHHFASFVGFLQAELMRPRKMTV
jgi:hypothetical protein